jgi:hypothetical protein
VSLEEPRHRAPQVKSNPVFRKGRQHFSGLPTAADSFGNWRKASVRKRRWVSEKGGVESALEGKYESCLGGVSDLPK